MKKILYIILVCCILCSCDKYTYYDLPKDKIPLLKNNDIAYFQDSASSRIDTFRLDVRNYRQITSENGSFETIDIYYNLTNRKDPIFLFRIKYSEYGFIKNYSLYIMNNFTLNGVLYATVYKGYYRYEDYNVDTVPNLVYYTYKQGIIRYEYKDGRVYNLVSK